MARERQIDLTLYFEENEGTVTLAVTLWEAHKAVMRDNIQNVISRKKKRELTDMEELEDRILWLEDSLSTPRDQSSLHRLAILKTEYQDLTTVKVQ